MEMYVADHTSLSQKKLNIHCKNHSNYCIVASFVMHMFCPQQSVWLAWWSAIERTRCIIAAAVKPITAYDVRNTLQDTIVVHRTRYSIGSSTRLPVIVGVCELAMDIIYCTRAGGNGTGFWGRKNGVAWLLTYACVIECPLQAVHCTMGRLNYGEVFFELFRVFKHPK